MSWVADRLLGLTKAVFPDSGLERKADSFLDNLSQEQKEDTAIYMAACDMCSGAGGILKSENIDLFIPLAIADAGHGDTKTSESVLSTLSSLTDVSGLDVDFKRRIIMIHSDEIEKRRTELGI